MAKQQISRQQQLTERTQREQDAERNQDVGDQDFGDQAASARLPDDPKAAAPRDAIGRPSTGEPI
ncbi:MULTISPECIES: hypothetical protein [Micromonospora]|uniref:Uncharacterized protein n=1 Tax=Micromonospora noduli TaxID=709876 RepID=A0A328NB93_9ACTN|nr:hypothetical protein [Micromonospora noduli]KAB1927768.1 hypothetical protein F8280_05950 [Micromonospora noduli]RAN97477.1 hypothetical protein GUI43_06184 [Micromonospora noduli]RAO07004.1 hypothetical protein LAH08_00268 [Micromonospora noduli]RAO21319.1 hypothetical protein LUPAC07_01136 [Micromonospora noduli]RAO28555.1 hypothetical protein ONO23_04827 [Micromonospora noduli]